MRKRFFLGAGRWLTAIAIGFCLFRLLWDGAAAGVPFDTVTAAVVQSVDLSQTKTADGRMIRRLYGLDPAEYAGCALYYPAGDMGVTELLLLRVQTDDQLETVQAAAQRRLDTQTNTFAGYAPEQYPPVQRRQRHRDKGAGRDVRHQRGQGRCGTCVPRGPHRAGGRAHEAD